MSPWERVKFLASGQWEPLTYSWHPLSQLKGKQRCLDVRARQLLVAGDTSAGTLPPPSGQEPCHNPVNPTWLGWSSSLSAWLHKERSPLPWGRAGTCSPLRPPRVYMSKPELGEVREMGEARQVTTSHVRSEESAPEGCPNSQHEFAQTKAMGFPRRQTAVSRREQPIPAQMPHSWRHRMS